MNHFKKSSAGGLPGIAAALGFAMDSEVHRPKAAETLLCRSASVSKASRFFAFGLRLGL